MHRKAFAEAFAEVKKTNICMNADIKAYVKGRATDTSHYPKAGGCKLYARAAGTIAISSIVRVPEQSSPTLGRPSRVLLLYVLAGFASFCVGEVQ